MTFIIEACFFGDLAHRQIAVSQPPLHQFDLILGYIMLQALSGGFSKVFTHIIGGDIKLCCQVIDPQFFRLADMLTYMQQEPVSQRLRLLPDSRRTPFF